MYLKSIYILINDNNIYVVHILRMSYNKKFIFLFFEKIINYIDIKI